MEITYQEKEKEPCCFRDNVYLIKLGTGEVVTLNDRTLVDPLEAFLVVTE